MILLFLANVKEIVNNNNNNNNNMQVDHSVIETADRQCAVHAGLFYE